MHEDSQNEPLGDAVDRQTPRLSIIIPSYNRPQRLATCLQSLCDLRGDFQCFEVAVVNDGSTVPYDETIAAFAGRLNLIYLQQENRGPAAARNHGARETSGEYIVFLDDDCALPPDWLKQVQAHAEQDAIVGGCTVNRLVDNVFSQASQVLIDYLYSYYNRDRDRGTFLTSNNMILPRRLFESIQGFDLDFSDAAAEDRDFCARLLHAGFAIKYRPAIKIHHYHHMQLGGYWRQHYRYGYSAQLYHRKRAQRDETKIRIEPAGFYWDLLCFPWRQKLPRAIRLSLLLFLSQVANALGFWQAKLSGSGR